MADPAPPEFPAAPPERIDLPDGLALVRCSVDRAPAAARAINESLDHLRPWMAWAAEPATEESIGGFFAESTELWDQRRDFGYSLIDVASDDIVGGCGLHGRIGRHGLEIGYWVHVGRAGRGIATTASRALTDTAFAIEGIERVRICCEEANAPSARIPEKLGFRFLGLEVPDEGTCAGRSTQVWEVDRALWLT